MNQYVQPETTFKKIQVGSKFKAEIVSVKKTHLKQEKGKFKVTSLEMSKQPKLNYLNYA